MDLTNPPVMPNVLATEARTPASPQRGRGRGRGGRGRGGRSRQAQAASAQLAPAPKGVEAVVPKPQHLSKKQTLLANDPLYMEAFVIEGDKGFVEEAGRKVSSPSFERFISLIERTYTQVRTTNNSNVMCRFPCSCIIM